MGTDSSSMPKDSVTLKCRSYPGTGQIHFTLSSLPQGFSLCSRPWVYALDTASNIISREELPPAMTWPGLQPRRSANSLRAMGMPAT